MTYTRWWKFWKLKLHYGFSKILQCQIFGHCMQKIFQWKILLLLLHRIKKGRKSKNVQNVSQWLMKIQILIRNPNYLLLVFRWIKFWDNFFQKRDSDAYFCLSQNSSFQRAVTSKLNSSTILVQYFERIDFKTPWFKFFWKKRKLMLRGEEEFDVIIEWLRFITKKRVTTKMYLLQALSVCNRAPDKRKCW